MTDGPPGFAPGELRDRMANERTLLAWVRTALALMGFGLVLAKFSLFLGLGEFAGAHARDPWMAHALGIGLVIVGVLVMALGGHRTLVYARVIDPHRRSPGGAPLTLTTAAVIGLGVLLALYLALSGP
ncbi:MAG: DUF202 domain-containing protein [Nannocystaceae bacterium]